MLGNVRANRAESVLARAVADVKAHRRAPLDISDMIALQNDFFDGFAERVLPRMIRLARTHLDKYPEFRGQQKSLNRLLERLENWDYVVSKKSDSTLIYSVWVTELKKTLLRGLFPDPEERETHAFSYSSETFLANLIVRWEQGHDFDNAVCELDSRKDCMYNLIFALAESWKFIVSALGEDVVLSSCFMLLERLGVWISAPIDVPTPAAEHDAAATAVSPGAAGLGTELLRFSPT